MNQAERPTPPPELKPWYYQEWFLFPMFVFWPLWPVLILRSPWHNGLISGTIAWAMLFAGSYLIYLRMQESATVVYSTVMFIAPGVILTIITQAHWLRYRKVVREATRPAGPPAAAAHPGRGRRSRRRRPSRQRG